MQLRPSVQRRHHALFLQAPPFGLRLNRKPIMGMRSKRQNVGGLLDRRKRVETEHFDRHAAGKFPQIELNHLREAGKIYDDKNGFVFVAAKKREDFGIVGKKKFESAA